MDELSNKINKAFELSAELFNSIIAIDKGKKHPMDDAETCRDIHNIQNRIISLAYKNNVKLKSKLR